MDERKLAVELYNRAWELMQQGVAAFEKSFNELISALQAKAAELTS